MSAPRRKSARWRKSKAHHWGKWELWRGEEWLAGITEVGLRGGGRVYLWTLVNRAPSGQADDLAAAKKTAKYALEHAEIEEFTRELAAEGEHAGASS